LLALERDCLVNDANGGAGDGGLDGMEANDLLVV